MRTLYEARVTSRGGRDGRVTSSDGALDLPIAAPRELGGTGDAGAKTNPEQLFAAGYAACFESALQFAAREKRIDAGRSAVACSVELLTDGASGFSLAARIEVSLPDLDVAAARSLVARAHEVCPYSNATRGNIAIDLRLAEHV